MIYSENNKIAVEPFDDKGMEKQVTSGVAFIKQKLSVKGLKVVFMSEEYPEGSVLYVSGEQYAAQWAKQIYELNDKRFILLPKELVLLSEGRKLQNPFGVSFDTKVET